MALRRQCCPATITLNIRCMYMYVHCMYMIIYGRLLSLCQILAITPTTRFYDK